MSIWDSIIRPQMNAAVRTRVGERRKGMRTENADGLITCVINPMDDVMYEGSYARLCII